MIKTVFFDIDDTLINHKLANEAAISWAHKAFFPKTDQIAFFTSWKQITQKYWQQFEEGLIDITEQRIKRFQEIWRNFDQELPSETAYKLYQNFLIHYEENWQLFENAQELLTDLTKRKILLGIITNGSEEQQLKKLTQTGIKEFFQEPLIVISEKFGVAKPNTKIFEHAQKQAQAKASEILIVGDKLDADIQVPAKLGWQVALVDHHNQYLEESTVTRLTSLSQVLALIS